MGDTTETKFCTNCKRDIAASNYVMHEVHCRRHVILCEHCQEPVARSEMESHFEEYHALQPCPMCNQQFEVSTIEKHKEEECPKRPGKCEFCEIQMPRDDLADHEKYCGTRTEHCALCQQYIMIKDFDRHSSSGCTYPERKQNAPKNTNRPGADYDPDRLLPDEMYGNFAMNEMSRILNTEIAPNVIPGHHSRDLADRAIQRSRPAPLEAAAEVGARRRKAAPRQPMHRRQHTSTQSTRNTNPDKNLRKKSNVQQRELAQLQKKPNNIQTSSAGPSRNNYGSDLDELLARHLAQDLSNGPTDHSHNLMSTEDIDDEFVLPCEFCGVPFPSEDLIQHQGMCAVGASDQFSIPSSHSADDILGAAPSPERVLPSRRTFDDDLFSAAQQPSVLNNHAHRRHQPSPPPEPQILDNFSDEIHQGFENDFTVEGDTMLPCEFCDNLFPGDTLLQHQVVCDANFEVEQSNVVETRSRTRASSNHAGPTNSRPTDSRRHQRHENASGTSRYGLNNGATFGASALTSIVKKDKDNKARQNLITKHSDRHTGSSEGGAFSESRVKRRQGIQNGASASYQPSVGNPVRTAPKLVNKARKQSQGDDRNLLVSGTGANRNNETSTNGTSRTAVRQTTNTNKLTNSTRPRKFPQGDN